MDTLRCLALGLLAAFCSACAYTTVKPVDYDDRTTRGVRVYDPKPVLVVTCDAVSIAYVPDFSRGYTIQSRAWLAKNDSNTTLTNGMLTAQRSILDTTGPLSLVQAIGSEVVKAAETVGALFGGGMTTGLTPGIYGFEYHDGKDALHPAGTLKGIQQIQALGSCATGDTSRAPEDDAPAPRRPLPGK